MPRPMKVFGGSYDGLNRVVVAATSAEKAHAAIIAAGCHLSLSHFRGYGSESHNETELALCLPEPGVVFRRSLNGGEYERLPACQ